MRTWSDLLACPLWPTSVTNPGRSGIALRAPCSDDAPPHEAIAQLPRSSFFAGVSGLISKSKISIGNPIVVHEFGMSTMPATCPCTGAQDSRR